MKSSIFDQKIDPRASFPDERKSPQAVELIVSIVDRGRGESVVRLLERQGSLFHTIVLGRGTAQERILDYLGLGETEKDVVISGYKALPHIEELRRKTTDKGMSDIEICFTALYGFLLLKLQKREISSDTASAISQISDLLRSLSEQYSLLSN